MPASNDSATLRRGRIRGRSQRTQSIGTKLTPQEETEVLTTAEGQGKVPSEWVRELILRELRSTASDAFFAEVVGVRLLLVNVLRPLATGQRLTAEAFDKLLDEISATKHELAAKLTTERRR